MGKKSGKGKRAKRSTEDIEDFLDTSTKDALSGGSLAQLPSDTLFVLDKTTDLPLKRTTDKHREKVLRCDSVLQRNAFVDPVPSSKSKKKSRTIHLPKPAQQDSDGGVTGFVDIWADKGDELRVKTKRKPKTSVIPAVEVEPPGCSFNPTPESHQDALACAVADEMQKIYRNELEPERIPSIVSGEAVNEEEMYFLEVDSGSDMENDLVEDGNTDLEKRPQKSKMVTQVERNRRAKRKEQLKASAVALKAEKISKEIDSLSDIIQEIEKEDEEKQKRHLRRITAKKERLKSCPPRLGKRKFEPAPAQVLLSEEITGSLRKLKGCCTLARDRFKSLEKRGLVIPSKKSCRR